MKGHRLILLWQLITNTISGSNPRDVVHYSLVEIEADTVVLELDRRGYKIM